MRSRMKPLVLVVDDDADVADSLKDVLCDEGYDVTLAGDGLEALAQLKVGPLPSVIVLDWMMPRCDGACFRARQLEDPAIASIPVLVLTADMRVREQVRGMGVE